MVKHAAIVTVNLKRISSTFLWWILNVWNVMSVCEDGTGCPDNTLRSESRGVHGDAVGVAENIPGTLAIHRNLTCTLTWGLSEIFCICRTHFYRFGCIQVGGLGLQPLIWTDQILDKSDFRQTDSSVQKQCYIFIERLWKWWTGALQTRWWGCDSNAVDLVIMSSFAVAVCWQRIIILSCCHLVAARMVQTEFCSTISATMPKSHHRRVPWVQCRALPSAIERLEGQ